MIFFIRERFTFRLMRHELGVSSATFTNWSSFCREVMVHWALDRQGMIGGQGKIVEIDESKFGRRKYNMGRVIDGQWVFGGICRETRDLFLVPVEDRTSDTLLAVIKERIAPGSIIISDCWKAYNCLSDEGFEHLTVNHSYHFVDPDTQAHTKTIEQQWREAKRKVPLCGRRKKHFAGYLARCMFLMHYQDLNALKILGLALRPGDFKAMGFTSLLNASTAATTDSRDSDRITTSSTIMFKNLF
nr:uncharacterized protein LOC113811624 [Penaeus vannamei]